MKTRCKNDIDDLANKIIDLHAEIETIREEVEKRRDKLPKSFLTLPPLRSLILAFKGAYLRSIC